MHQSIIDINSPPKKEIPKPAMITSAHATEFIPMTSENSFIGRWLQVDPLAGKYQGGVHLTML